MMTRRRTPFAIGILLFFAALPARAAHGNYAEAMRVRTLIEQQPGDFAGTVIETITLPVSRPFDQSQTQLCWSYATLNALETNYLVVHPDGGLELSRRTMQYLTMEDRWTRKIEQTDDYISERGTAVDALTLIRANGLVAFADFTDIADPYGPNTIADAVSEATSATAKLEALQHALAAFYGAPPATTHLGSAAISRAALAAAVLGVQTWESYAIARDGQEGYRQHPDADARPGAQSFFMRADKIVARIHTALAAGFALEITVGGHCLEIYGARYDAAGLPLSYLAKDSYPGYFYEVNPAKMLDALIEMTTVKI